MARRAVGAIVSIGLVGAATLAGGSGTAAADTPQNRIAITAWQSSIYFGGLTDEGLYVHRDDADGLAVIYRHALVTGPTGNTVSEADVVGGAEPETTYAVHDGAVAYIKDTDGRLAIRHPNGTTTSPAWADTEDYPSGIETLTSSWVLGSNGTEPTVRRLSDGVGLDLLGLCNASADSYSVTDVALTDDRVAWVMAQTTTPPRGFHLCTVALDAVGPTGWYESVTLQSQTVGPMPAIANVGILGDTLVWSEYTGGEGGTYTHNLRWDFGSPYDGADGGLALGMSTWAEYTGEQLVLVTRVPPAPDDAYRTPRFTASWRDAAAPATPVRTTGVIDGNFVGVAGSLLVYATGEGAPTTWLTDAAGLPVRAEGWRPPASFSDVWPWEPFATEIVRLADAGVTNGYSDGTFRRTAPVNRDAMAAFLYRMVHHGDPTDPCTSAPFSDVPVAHPFCAQIAWLADTGISTGYADGTFRPGVAVTREAMAAFLRRLHEQRGASSVSPTCEADRFSDVGAGHPFCAAITWLATTGVSTGWADGTFRPGAPVERQAMAAFLIRFIDAGLADGDTEEA